MQRDRRAYADSNSLYEAVKSNSIKLVDPWGFESEHCKNLKNMLKIQGIMLTGYSARLNELENIARNLKDQISHWYSRLRDLATEKGDKDIF